MTEPAEDRPLADLAQHILNNIIATFEAAEVGLPERQLITFGELVVDANSGILGVIFGGCHLGPPGNEDGAPKRFNYDSPRSAIFDVELWRKITVQGGGGVRARPPRASTVTNEAAIGMVDTWLLMEAGVTSDFKGGPGVAVTTAPLPPSGGLQGVSMQLTLQVP